MTAENVKRALEKVSSAVKAKACAWFFKTGPGEYGEGDKFIGVTVPEQRKVARQFRELSRIEIGKLLRSEVHEHRLTALFILVDQFKKAKKNFLLQKELTEFYLDHRAGVNNWDLVDSSAHLILGAYLANIDEDGLKIQWKGESKVMRKEILEQFAREGNLWEKRIAMIATAHFIHLGRFEQPLRIAEILVHSPEDLLQKAVGWMLREIGKKDLKAEERFLDKYYKTMPRTMLRYAIEKFTPEKRRHYMGRV